MVSNDEESMLERRFSTTIVLAVVLAAGTAVACNTTDDTAPDDRRNSGETRGEALTSGENGEQTTLEAPFAEDPSETMLPSEQVREVDWEAAAEYPTLESGLVSEELQSFYEEAPVPVLLPADRKALASVEPTVGANWYAAKFEREGREVTIEGDRVAREADLDEFHPADDSATSENSYRISQTHGVLTLSFTAFGAAYTLDIECREVDQRGTCTDKSFAVDTAGALERLGGNQ